MNQDEEEEETNQSEPEKLENLVSDDESVGEKQDLLPRLSGGGRRLLQDFRYVCLWCSEEVLQQKQRGRFRELRNYRDHFRKAHSDVPMREFLLKVERDEPKWICNICRKKISLGNRLSHQIICRPALESSSSSDNDDEPITQSVAKTASRTINDPIPSCSKSTSTQTAHHNDSDSEPIPHHRKTNKRQLNSSSEDSEVEEPQNLSMTNEKKKKVVYSSPPLPLNLTSDAAPSVPNVALSNPQDNEEDYDVYDFDLELEEEIIMSEIDAAVSTSSETHRS